MRLSAGILGLVAAFTLGAGVALADVAPPPEEVTAIDGRWQLGDGMVVELAGGRYQLYENGEAAEESGSYRIEGDRIWLTEGNSSEENTGRFTLGADVLLLEPDDESPMLLRAETPTGPAPAGSPADLLGRWRTSENDVIELLADGRAIHEGRGGAEESRYRVEGDRLIVEETPGGEDSRMRWMKLGDRIVLEMEGDDEVIILTPEAGGAAAPAPEPGTQVSELLAEIPAAEAPAASDDPVTQPAVDTTAASAPPAGRWIMGPGLVIAFGDGRYEVIENGQVQVNGTFTVEGDTLLLRRDTDPEGQIRRSRFTREGDAMLIEPEGDEPAVLFAETPSGSATVPDPLELEGRWRTMHGDLIELRDGRYAYVGEDGSAQRGGTYSVAGDTLTMRPETGRETAGRWALIGARIVVQLDDGQAVILAPEPATAQLPQVPAVAAAETPAEAPRVEPAGEQPAGQVDTDTLPQQPSVATELEQPTPPSTQPEPPPAQPQVPLSEPPPLPVTPEPLIPPAGRALSDGTPLGEQWAGYLKAKRMAQGVGQPMVQVLDLCSDGQYFWLVGQGTAMPQPQGTGYWSIVTQGPVASLQLTPVGAQPGQLKLDFDGQSAYLNGIPTQVLQMNQSCP